MLRGDTDGIARVALHWTPEGKRKRGRPKITWRLTVESELKLLNLNWGEAAKLAKDRNSESRGGLDAKKFSVARDSDSALDLCFPVACTTQRNNFCSTSCPKSF